MSFLLIWIFIAVLAILSVGALKAPAPRPATAPETEFSAERAMAHVREIARVPHPINSAANGAVRDYLLAQLARLGVQASVFTETGVDPNARFVTGGRTNDIVGLLPGSAGGQAILLMAHYDSVPDAPGAGDDAAAVAAILETVRALRAGPALQRDLIILFTDGEEAGLLGADAFAHGNPLAKKLGLILNFDARGNRGPSLMFETSPNNAELVDAAARFAPHPIGSSLFYELYKLLPNDTDFTAFRASHVPGLNFAFGENLQAYHSPLDTPANLSLASLQHHGSYGLALVRHFGQLDLSGLQKARGNDVFFDWFGDRLIAYRQSWVLPGQILVTVLLVAALVIAFRRHEATAGRFLLALVAALITVVLVIVVTAAGFWLVTLILGGRRIISDSPANLFLLGGLMFLSAGCGTLLLGWLRRRLGLEALSLAALSLWCLLSWMLALQFPSGSYLLFWPLLFGLAGNLSMHLHRGETGFPVRILPAVLAAVLLFAPFIYLLYIFLTLQMISVAASALLAALFLLILTPLTEAAPGPSASLRAVSLGVAALVCLACGIALSGRTAQYPREDSLVYSLNADDHSAVWITYDPRPDRWTSQFFTANPQGPKPQEKYLAGFARPYLAATAQALPLLPPMMEVAEDKKDGEVHRLKLKIRSQRNADALYLRLGDGVQPVSMKVAGRDIPVNKNGRFGLTWYGLGNDPLDVELAVTGSTVSFWLMDRSNSLPVDVPPRPAGLMLQDGSDVTFVCRKYNL